MIFCMSSDVQAARHPACVSLINGCQIDGVNCSPECAPEAWLRGLFFFGVHAAEIISTTAGRVLWPAQSALLLLLWIGSIQIKLDLNKFCLSQWKPLPFPTSYTFRYGVRRKFCGQSLKTFSLSSILLTPLCWNTSTTSWLSRWHRKWSWGELCLEMLTPPEQVKLTGWISHGGWWSSLQDTFFQKRNGQGRIWFAAAVMMTYRRVSMRHSYTHII